MGYGPTKNGKQTVITPRNGKNWCDVVNKGKTCPKCQHDRGFRCPICWPKQSNKKGM